MISKLLFAVLFPVTIACSDAGVSKANPAPTQDDTASAQADEESGDYENAQYRAHRTPPRITKFDANHDGVLQATEVPPRLRTWFANVDANKDNVVTADEIRAWNRAHPHHHGHHHGQGGGGQGGGGQQGGGQQQEAPQHVGITTL
jgi:hypothetical protein